MNILTFDMETFYDKQFSLSKLTTEEYLRDTQFEVIGVSVQLNDGAPEWFSGTMEETGAWLRKFDWASNVAVAHNAMFDLAILNWHFDLRPKRIVDTLSMARAIHGTEVGGSLAALVEHYELGKKGTEVLNARGKRRLDFAPDELDAYGEYCKNDTALTYKLFGCLLSTGFSVDELRLIDVTVRMFSEPVLQIDAPLLEAHLIAVKEKKEKLLSKALVHKDDLMSNPKFAYLLITLNVVPPMKVSPATGKETYAFSKQDEEFMALLEHPNVLVQLLVSARLGLKSTLEETRTERFINIAKRGSLPIPLKYYAAHTGRWGGCLVDDTEVLVYDVAAGVQTKRIVDVLLDDLVWDGEAFVPHEGVVFSGFSEVIKWDGIAGTEDHVVFTDAGEISLRDALQGGHRLKTANSPTQDAVEAARQFTLNYEEQTPM